MLHGPAGIGVDHRVVSGRIVIATHNAGKLQEIADLLAPYRVDPVSAAELGLAEPVESGTSFLENAQIKAAHAAAASELPALADDSGLVVDALDGAPGLHSARWAGPGKDFAAAMHAIESLLNARGAARPQDRRARFVCALCIAWPDEHFEQFEGQVDGHLVWPPRGNLGFGYDPIFQPEGFSRTFGEMTREEKHSLPRHGPGLSHRAQAFAKLAENCLEPR